MQNYLVGFITVVGLFTYMTLDAIDGIHARVTKNSSPVGELIDHGCDSIGIIFIGLLSCKIFGVSDPISVWYLTMSLSMIFQLFHIKALVTDGLVFGTFTGPSEILIYLCILILCVSFGCDFSPIMRIISGWAHMIFHVMFLINMMYMNFNVRYKYQYSANGYSFVYLIILIRTFFLTSTNIFETIADNFVLSTLTCDVIISKMASKNLSQWIVVLALITQLDKFIGFFACMVFICMNVKEIAEYMNIPIFSTNINVYCCGVFDLCHGGHCAMFENAMKFGNKLIVGVHSDADVASYKRISTMTHEERCNEVRGRKFVSKVIPNAPLVISKQELEDNNIHYVICSNEYFNVSGDTYYELPRSMGILREVPYSNKISTSDLIRRIIANASIKSSNSKECDRSHLENCSETPPYESSDASPKKEQ